MKGKAASNAAARFHLVQGKEHEWAGIVGRMLPLKPTEGLTVELG